MKRPPAILPGLLLPSLLAAALPLAPRGAAYGQSDSQKREGKRPRLGDFTPPPSQTLAAAAADDARRLERRDPDLAPGEDEADKAGYIRRRNEYIARLRGYLPGRPFDPAARVRAIRETELKERQVSGAASLFQKFATLLELTQPVSADFWTPVGPSPVPRGQTVGRADPVSGRTIAIAVHPTDPKIVYAGTAAGGLYRSVDGGDNWKAIFDDAESLAVGAIAIAPSRPTTVYVGTGEIGGFFGAGVYRIDDAESDNPTVVGPINPVTDQGDGIVGPAFQQTAVSEILVHPTDAATIFVSTTRAVGGVVTHNHSEPNARSMYGVYRSRNATAVPGTVAFKKLTVNDAGGFATGDTKVTDMVMEPGNPKVILCWVMGEAGARGGGVYRTDNALEAAPSFAHKHTTVTKDARGELAIHKGANGVVTVLAATGEKPSGQCRADEFGRLRRSTDGGLNWQETLTKADGFCGGQCEYDIAVETAQSGAPPVIHIGGSGQFNNTVCPFTTKRSADGGANFDSNDTGLHPDVHAFAVAPSNPNVVYTGNDGGIWKSTDGGVNWVSVNKPGYNATQFVSMALHPTDREYMAGGTQDNGTELRKEDGSWVQVEQGDGGYTLIDSNADDTVDVKLYITPYSESGRQIYFQRVTTTAAAEAGNWPCFGFGSLRGVRCRANGINPRDSVLFYAPMALGPGNPNTLYFGTDRLYRSDNMGGTMRVVGSAGAISSPVIQPGGAPTPMPISSISVSPLDDDVRVVGLSNGEVWATTAGGTLVNVTPPAVTQPNFPAGAPVGRVFTDPNNKETAYVTYGGFGVPFGRHVFKTTTLGGSPAPVWADAGFGIPDVPVNAFAVDPSDSRRLFAGTDIGVYRSFDGGNSWVPFNEGLPRVPVFDMGFQGAKKPGGARILRIATHGRGVWEIQVGGGEVSGCQTRLTLSSSHAVTVGRSASCDTREPTFFHTDTSFWRAFPLESFGVDGPYNVTSVSFGINWAEAGAGRRTQPVVVRLYASNGRPFPEGTRTELASTTVEVENQIGKLLNVPLAADVPAGTTELVMEVFTPDGRDAGNRLYVGANNAAESGPGYMSAPFCGINAPTPLDALGLTATHVVMKISGSCAAPAPRPVP